MSVQSNWGLLKPKCLSSHQLGQIFVSGMSESVYQPNYTFAVWNPNIFFWQEWGPHVMVIKLREIPHILGVREATVMANMICLQLHKSQLKNCKFYIVKDYISK